MIPCLSLPCLDDVLSIKADPLPFKRKAVIYSERSPAIYFVHEGAVRVFRDASDGVRTTVDFYGPGHFFGLSCLDSGPRHETAVVHSACLLSEWPLLAVAALMEERPEIARALLRAGAEHNARLFERLLRIECLKIGERLRATLLDIASRIGTTEGTAITMRPGPTHQVLAECIGTSREVVTGHLNRFQREGGLLYTPAAMVIYTDRLGAMKEPRKAAA